MDVLLGAVYVVEQVAGHEGVITLGMRLWQTDILIHVEGKYIFEGYLTGAVGFYQGIVHTYGRGTRRQTEYELVVRRRIKLIDTLDH